MPIVQTTIFDLRNIVIPIISDSYYITDENCQGNWFYDPGDTTSADNLATILVGLNNARYKRVYENGVVNVKWFGAIGNGVSDDTIAIQNAINFISSINITNVNARNSGGGVVFFPKSVYKISKTLVVGQECKLLGLHKSTDVNFMDYPGQLSEALGSVIFCAFTESNLNNWAISSACYDINGNLLGFDKKATWVNATWNYGLCIEGLFFYGGVGDKRGYGGIRLALSQFSKIENCTCFNFKIGFLLTSCFNSQINNLRSQCLYYGLVVENCNAIDVDSSAFSNVLNTPYTIPQSNLPEFAEILYYWDLNINDTIRYGNAGVFVNGGNAINISALDTKSGLTNGSVFAYCNGSINSYYLETISSYGIVLCGKNTSIKISGVYGFNLNYYFYFGDFINVQVSTFMNNESIESPNLNLLFYPDTLFPVNKIPKQRNITFSETKYSKVEYSPSVILLNNTKLGGPNDGIIYINIGHANTSDNNYGFSEDDPLLTFDAALVRIINQTTLNPVRKILINYVENESYSTIKDLTIKELENCDVLISKYSDNLNNPVIYFGGQINNLHEIGQIRLNGNVVLTIKDIDIICFDPQGDGCGINLTVFGLKNCFAKLNFINVNLQYGIWYYLFENLFGNSSLETKMVDSILNGSQFFSPPSVGGKNIIVDCVQIGSTSTPTPWVNAVIIRNNL